MVYRTKYATTVLKLSIATVLWMAVASNFAVAIPIVYERESKKVIQHIKAYYANKTAGQLKYYVRFSQPDGRVQIDTFELVYSKEMKAFSLHNSLVLYTYCDSTLLFANQFNPLYRIDSCSLETATHKLWKELYPTVFRTSSHILPYEFLGPSTCWVTDTFSNGSKAFCLHTRRTPQWFSQPNAYDGANFQPIETQYIVTLQGRILSVHNDFTFKGEAFYLESTVLSEDDTSLDAAHVQRSCIETRAKIIASGNRFIPHTAQADVDEHELLVQSLLDSGSQMPHIYGRDQSVNSALPSNTIRLIDFWYVGCAPCELSMTVLNKMANTYRDSGVVVYGLNAYDDEKRIDIIRKRLHVTYPLLPISSTVLESWKVSVFPTLYLIDRSGHIVHTWVGLPDEQDLGSSVQAELRKCQQ